MPSAIIDVMTSDVDSIKEFKDAYNLFLYAFTLFTT